ncbi:MAG TPA: hypothetical protein VNQ76_00150 [Planctomicrobium sp.]|nr:hypothetical protein [Planctomicrobium sp.]
MTMRPRENPFRVECLEALTYRFQSGGLETLLHKLALNNHRGAIVGPHGHGKSTLLALLEQTLRQQRILVRSLQLTEANCREQSRLVREWLISAGPNAMLLLDGAEQLGYWNWFKVRWFSRFRRGLVVTSHRAGLLPTVFNCETNPKLLDELVLQLTGKTSLPGMDSSSLFETHQGNLRDCLRTLYDQAFQIEFPSHP